MMKLTARSRYALRCMIELARRTGQSPDPISLGEVGKAIGCSRKYLEQLMVAFKRSGLVQGFAGRSGGYRLGREAAAITMSQILTAVSGPLELSICVDRPGECVRSEACPSRCVWVQLTGQIEEVLDRCTLAELLDPDALRTLQLRAVEIEHRRSGSAQDK